MKKNFLSKAGMALGIALCALTANAQETTTDGTNANNGKADAFSIDYMGIDGGFGINMDMTFGYLDINGGWISGKTNDYIKDNSGWQICVGGNYRYWLGKSFFIEGKAGVGYYHSSVEMRLPSGTKTTTILGKSHTSTTYTTEKESNGEFGLYVSPRAGLHVGKIAGCDWSIVAGYRWDFIKFKFDKDYTNDYFTIGISAGI